MCAEGGMNVAGTLALEACLSSSLPSSITVKDPAVEVLTLLRILHGISKYWHSLYLVVYFHSTPLSVQFQLCALSLGTVENHGKKGKKTWQTFAKITKITAKTRHQNHGPEDHYTVYKIQCLSLTTIITCSARYSSVKFCHCGALTNSRKKVKFTFL